MLRQWCLVTSQLFARSYSVPPSLRQCPAMGYTRALAIALGMVIILLLCSLPATMGCDAAFAFVLPELLGIAALACIVVMRIASSLGWWRRSRAGAYR